MKRLILIIILGAFLSPVATQASALNLRLHDGARFHVELDGIPYFYPSSDFDIGGLRPGKHFINVYRHDYLPRGREKVRLVYSGKIRVPNNMKVFAIIEPGRKLRVVKEEALFIAGMGMHPAAFEHLRMQMLSNPFDGQKLRMAKREIAEHGVNSSQVAQLADLMAFESNKLDLAKFAYRFTTDPYNYHYVYNVFTFRSSVKDLERFIRRHRR